MHKVALGTVVLALGLLGAQAAHAQMSIKSNEVSDGATIKDEQVGNTFGCKGGDVSPSLNWSGAPKDTKSFAITMYDPDAPTGSGFWHWVVFNIPPTATSLAKGAGNAKGKGLPKGAIQARNDTGGFGYTGPCPPQGDKPHHYIITVYAVKQSKLPFAKDRTVTPAVVGFSLHFNALEKASMTATYGR